MTAHRHPHHAHHGGHDHGHSHGHNPSHGHSHGHGHSHAPSGERQALLAFLVTAVFMLLEAVGGWVSGSLALLADAGHMFTDAMALLLAWAAFRIGRLGADPKRSYGYRRAEVLAALFNGVTVLALAVWIVWEAVGRIADPQPVDAVPMLVVSVLGFLANLLTLRILGHGHSHGNLNLRGAALHVIGDLFGSLAAAVGAVVILIWGWTVVDPVLSLLVAGLIVYGALHLMVDSAHILLEGAPEGFDETELREHLLTHVPGLVDVHHVHAWSITSGQTMLTLHAEIGPDSDHQAILTAMKHQLAHHLDFPHSVVQIERTGCGDEGCE